MREHTTKGRKQNVCNGWRAHAVVLTWTGTKRHGRRRRRRQRRLLLFIESHHQRPGPTPWRQQGASRCGGGRRQRGSRAHAHGGAARRSHQPIIVFDVTGFVSAASGVEEISMHPRNPSQAPGGRQPPTERRKWLARARASFCTCIVHSASLPLSGNVKMPSHTTSYGLATG